MFLHETPHGDQPPLENREHEKPDASSSHRSRTSWCPTEKPEIVADGEVEIHDHIAHGHGHPLVHIHVHAIIVSESTCDQ
jgi:hypothetical protein